MVNKLVSPPGRPSARPFVRPSSLIMSYLSVPCSVWLMSSMPHDQFVPCCVCLVSSLPYVLVAQCPNSLMPTSLYVPFVSCRVYLTCVRFVLCCICLISRLSYARTYVLFVSSGICPMICSVSTLSLVCISDGHCYLSLGRCPNSSLLSMLSVPCSV